MIAPVAIVTPAASGPGWSTAAVARLDGDVDALLGVPSLRGAHVGVVAIETATGRVLYAHNANDEFQPASTLKLLVGSVALDELGPQYRFTTELLQATDPARAGKPAFVLRAAGDPFLSASDIGAAAQAMFVRGASTVRSESGSANEPTPQIARRLADDPARTYVDSSHFDAVSHPRGWTWDDFAYPYAAPISAAILDENVISLNVSAGANVGAPTFVVPAATQTPPGKAPTNRGGGSGGDPGVTGAESTIRSQTIDVLAFGASRCVAEQYHRTAVVPRATTLAAGAEATADAALEPHGCLAIVGGVPLGGSSNVEAAVQDAPRFVGVALGEAYGILLQYASSCTVVTPFCDLTFFHRPVAVTSPVVEPPDPPASLVYAAAPIWQHDSEPYATWLGPRFWIPSDNLVAEALLKEVGVHAFGVPGTTANGVRAETAWLRSIGVDPATTTLADGSGLSQYDRLTPSDALAILQHDWNGPNRALVFDSLPVGGARGTIEGIAGSAAVGRVFAKTGSFSHVRALAGYLAPLRHGAVTFAFDVDDWNGDYADLAATRARVLARIVSD